MHLIHPLVLSLTAVITYATPLTTAIRTVNTTTICNTIVQLYHDAIPYWNARIPVIVPYGPVQVRINALLHLPPRILKTCKKPY